MADIQKPMSKMDSQQVLKEIFNQTDHSITTASFISSKVGNKIERAAINATTDDYSYFDGATLLYTIRVVYATSSKEEISSVERTA